mmetsp:Transcript_4214/g.9180  ORF Transcript_4214/g.9180 Transcript_4214/m.9180 type:complete len:263 (-) Transcript_4214:1486-2274(-)
MTLEPGASRLCSGWSSRDCAPFMWRKALVSVPASTTPWTAWSCCATWSTCTWWESLRASCPPPSPHSQLSLACVYSTTCPFALATLRLSRSLHCPPTSKSCTSQPCSWTSCPPSRPHAPPYQAPPAPLMQVCPAMTTAHSRSGGRPTLPPPPAPSAPVPALLVTFLHPLRSPAVAGSSASWEAAPLAAYQAAARQRLPPSCCLHPSATCGRCAWRTATCQHLPSGRCWQPRVWRSCSCWSAACWQMLRGPHGRQCWRGSVRC